MDVREKRLYTWDFSPCALVRDNGQEQTRQGRETLEKDRKQNC